MKATTMHELSAITVDFDDDSQSWKLVFRDDTGMPFDECGSYPTKAKANVGAANKRYALKTRRPVVARTPA